MQKNHCKECKQKIFYRWELSANGRKKSKRINGLNYYKASCPLCNCSWYVRRQEDTCRSDYHPAPVTP